MSGQLKSYYLVTMWSGGKPAKKWLTDGAPEVLPSGTGISFIDIQTKLQVQLIGSLSIEEYESGKSEIEIKSFYHTSDAEDEGLSPPATGGEADRKRKSAPPPPDTKDPLF